ncbi:MAG: DUF2207 domain-containing protein [Vicinamibacterales bacterium]
MTHRHVAFALVCLLVWPVAAAGQRSLVIQQFDADVGVGRDGVITVTETIRPRFTGSWNGLYRTIPIEYRTPQGFTYDLRLDIESVTDEAGAPLRYESSRERHYRKLKIWIPDARDAVKTAVVRYRVRNGLKFFDEHDELYWNITGDEWDVPIERARAVIHLPPDVTGIRAHAFTGGYGSQESAAAVSEAGTTLTVETTRALNFREGVTVAIAWNPGVVARPTGADKTRDFLSANVTLLIPFVVFGVMYWLWNRNGRDPRRQPVAVRYEPPGGLTPAEVGTLVDNSPDMRDITATVVDLAVRGFIRIRETQEDRFLGLGTKTEYSLQLVRPDSEWKGLRRHEEALLRAVFGTTAGPSPSPAGSGPVIDEVSIDDLKNRFYKHVPEIKERVFSQLIDRGYYLRRPDRVRATFFVLAGVVAIGGSVVSGIADAGAAPFVASILSGLIIGVFGYLMPARTVEGARALEGSLGFEEFLDRVESDRFDRLIKTPAMFEKFLPFAMALGVERNWARAFEGIYTSQPDWYVGAHPGAFGPRVFAASLANMTTTASTAMTSAPRSSGGSGVGGGGFSGGGFGGGGGGGF